MALLKLILQLTCLCVLLSTPSQSSKILAIFPIPSKSHYILGESLLRGLASKGHEVTMISPYSLSKPIKNYKDVKLTGLVEIKDKFGTKFSSLNTTEWEKMQLSFELFPLLFHAVHNNSNLQEFIKRGEKYDACVVSFFIMESLYAICDSVKAVPIGFSIVGLSSLLTYQTNNPVPYSYVPNAFLSYSDHMTFLQRVINVITWISMDAIQKFLLSSYQANLVKQYYPDAPPLNDLMENVDLYLMNSHISTDSPKAILQNIITIGGYHLQIMDEIPKETKKFLDESKNGVIYFSMGSNVKSSDFDENTRQIFINTFSKLDYDVLWKYEENLPNKPKNVRIESWLPQRPILSHPKIKVFLTHGGLGGTVESIYGGVPMICFPMFGDQAKNCAEGAQNGHTIKLDLRTITEEDLMKAIKEVLEKPEYKEKIMLKSDIYRNQEMNPMDKAIFWVEHAIRHKGAKHMKSIAASIPWYQYYLIDVVSFLLGILMVFLSICYFIVKLNLRLLCWSYRKLMGKGCNQKKNLKKTKKNN